MIAREAQLPLEEVRTCRLYIYGILCCTTTVHLYLVSQWIDKISLAGQAIIEWQAKEEAKYVYYKIA